MTRDLPVAIEPPSMAHRVESAWIISAARASSKLSADPLDYFRTRDAFVDGWKNAYRDAQATLLREAAL